MAAAAAAAIATTSPAIHRRRSTTIAFFHRNPNPNPNTNSYSSTSSSSLFRRGRRRNRKTDLNLNPNPSVPATDLGRLRRRTEAEIRRLLDAADDAYSDLATSVHFVGGDRVVFSCRRSSLEFVASALFWGAALAVAAKVLVQLALGFWRRRRRWADRVVVRRDRSLGGKEVVVGREVEFSRFLANPVSPARGEIGRSSKEKKRERRREELPEWWPEAEAEVEIPEVGGKEEWRRQANRLVRAIIDIRTSGKDYRYDDAIQLRQICRISGVKVSFDTTNARDSFYRAVINFVLDNCSRAAQATENVQINGEDPRAFVAGLAGNIGLDDFRAATLICATVAARTRACFLQSWALEVQGKRSEAREELLKICLVHRMFPPEENSAEMEMVASGLMKNLQAGERKHLLALYKDICTSGNYRSASEALGLAA